tara:strand:+ start:328 stop:696 length:369 start_codon:yes stop_codon:yes gene_type:complete
MSNKPSKFTTFKGEHPYFKDGVAYCHMDYSKWTFDNDPQKGVIKSTISGRLKGEKYCEPRHLLPVVDFAAQSEAAKKMRGFCKEARLRVLNTPRLETRVEEISMHWLSTKLTTIDPNYRFLR